MKKLLILAGFMSAGSVFAAPSAPMMAESVPASCKQYHQQMKQNHQAIDAAYDKKDACTMGKLMMQNRQIFESHPECFPKRRQMMQQQQGAQGMAPMAK